MPAFGFRLSAFGFRRAVAAADEER